MYNEPYLEDLLQKYEVMIGQVTEHLLSQKFDLSDPTVQAEYRLACMQTNTYLSIQQSLYGGFDSEPEDDPDSELDLD